MIKQRIGKLGEDVACRYLTSKGYACVDRNVHFREGEIDLVMRHGDELVFVEVKCRTSRAFGTPEEAVNARKLRRVRGSIFRYLAKHEWRGQWRLDLVAIELDRGAGSAAVRHLQSI